MSDKNKEIGDLFPVDTQSVIKSIWNQLNPETKDRLQAILFNLPDDKNLLRNIIFLSGKQFRFTFGTKRTIAILGPANVGKSTFYNQFIQKKENHVAVSPVPGTTREKHLVDAGIFNLFDTPGMDAVGDLGEKEKQIALNAASEADFIILMFDASQGIKKSEMEIFETIKSMHAPYMIVLNKIDLVKASQQRIIKQAAENLGIETEHIIPISAKKGHNIDKVILAVATFEPQIIAALGQALPEYRSQLAWKTIISAASLSGAIALTPLPFLDFAPLVIAQATMVLGIARIYNYKINFSRAKEIVITFGLGFLGRTLFQELSKLGGIPGWLLSAAIAASTTVVMGQAACIWFEKGEKLSSDQLKTLVEKLTKQFVTILRREKKQKPGKEEIKEIISQTMQQTIPENLGEMSEIEIDRHSENNQ